MPVQIPSDAIEIEPGYFVTRDGRVFSRKRQLCASPNVIGYPQVTLRIAGRQCSRTVHRLVCRAFHGEPKPGQEVRHLDGTRSNNHADNLAWGTVKDNHADRAQHGRAPRGENNPSAKLNEHQVRLIRIALTQGARPVDLGRQFNVHPNTITDIKQGHKWRHIA